MTQYPHLLRHKQVWSYTDHKQVKHLKYCLEPMINGEGIVASICKDIISNTDRTYQPQLWMYKVSSISDMTT